MSMLLSPLGKVYGRIMAARNSMYQRGRLKSHSFGIKTISIGNITAGGTGKTPIAAKAAAILHDSGEKVCILTRGFGRKNAHKRVVVSDGEQILANAEDSGDEPLELAGKLLGKAAVIADADRISAGEWAKEFLGITAFVLDDAFQHRKVDRDVDIVCIDTIDPFGGGEVLPAGLLREPIDGLKRASAIILTRCDLSEQVEKIRSELHTLVPDVQIFTCKNEILRISQLDGAADLTTADIDGLGKCVAFCGLGNPGNFFEMLRQQNFDVVGKRAFTDHHTYTLGDIEQLNETAAGLEADAFITTGKDAVKLSAARFDRPCFTVEIEPVLSDEDAFIRLITRRDQPA